MDNKEEKELLETAQWSKGTTGIWGYFPFSIANKLVGTGKYIFLLVTHWGYVIKKKD